MNLRNRTILITRQRTQAGDMVQEIERCGGRAVIIPMITIAPPPSWRECDEAIGRLASYDALVFMSVNAVESFVGRVSLLGVPPSATANVRTIAVGEATATALGHFGFRVSLVPEQFSGSALSGRLDSWFAGKRVLIPRGNLAAEDVPQTLQRIGAIVESVTVYITAGPDSREAESLPRRALGGEFDVISFASPSAARNFSTVFLPGDLAKVSERAKIAVIGPSTAEAVRSIGLPVDIVARESTARGLIQRIDEYFSQRV